MGKDTFFTEMNETFL